MMNAFVTDEATRPHSESEPHSSATGVAVQRVRALQQLGLLLIVLLIGLGSVVFVDNFFTVLNTTNVLRTASLVVIVSCGMTLLMISRGLDLSVGSTLALASVMIGIFSNYLELPWYVAVLAGLAAGVAVGLANAFIITFFDMNPILTTLGTMTAIRGVAYIAGDGLPIPVDDETIYWLGGGLVGPVPVPVIIATAVVLLCYFIQSRTVLGLHMYSMGGNEEAARLSGIKVTRIKYLLYVFCGVCAAIAGLIITGRLYSGQPVAGIGMEFDAITAVIVGGTSLDGGVGSVLGTVTGALFIAMINNIMVLLGISYFWQQVAKGSIIIVAIIIDQKLRRIRL